MLNNAKRENIIENVNKIIKLEILFDFTGDNLPRNDIEAICRRKCKILERLGKHG